MEGEKGGGRRKGGEERGERRREGGRDYSVSEFSYWWFTEEGGRGKEKEEKEGEREREGGGKEERTEGGEEEGREGGKRKEGVGTTMSVSLVSFLLIVSFRRNHWSKHEVNSHPHILIFLCQ